MKLSEMFRKHIVTKEDKTIFSNVEIKCLQCISTCTSSNEIINCIVSKEKRRRGKIVNDEGAVYLCTGQRDYINSSRIFKEKLLITSETLMELEATKNEIKDDLNKDSKRLIHNLTSLNAHNIQELYNLVPQDVLTEEYSRQINIIGDLIIKHPEEAAKMFIRIAKHNAAMKTEFSVFKKLYEPNPILQPKRHNVRKVVLNVLHTFFQDFTDNFVHVEVKSDVSYLEFDYESMHVALYHIIENATKYTASHSTLIISFVKNPSSFDIAFEMLSIKIENDEINLILDEGYCGKNAKELNKNGSGIGLNRVKRILELNNAELIVKNNIKPSTGKYIIGVKYETNQFILRFHNIASLGNKRGNK